MTSPTPSPARLEELEKIAREAPAGLTAPSWSGDGQGYIWGKSIKGGQTVIAQVRGWGYLTGKGHGALRLSEEEAIAIQGAWERHIAAFDPPQCLELLALIRAQAERIAELEGGGEAAGDDCPASYSIDKGHERRVVSQFEIRSVDKHSAGPGEPLSSGACQCTMPAS